jgi:hypothetical protein
MVLAVLRKIEARGSIETAKRVRGYICAVFTRAKAEKLVERNVLHDLEDIKDALKPTPKGQKQPARATLGKLLDRWGKTDLPNRRRLSAQCPQRDAQ